MPRAMWKAELQLGRERVPVKLYSAVQSRSVHFRLLHARDGVPVKQRMVDPRGGRELAEQAARKAFRSESGELVLLGADELEALQPAASRQIELFAFVPRAAVADYWYDRPYYLGPDGDEAGYRALQQALARSGQLGLARWVMHRKRYRGLLDGADAPLRLIALRSAEQVLRPDELDAPEGRAPERRELELARQLVAALAGAFEPQDYRDEYRAQVEALIARKARGERVKARPPRRAKPRARPLADALRASLKRAKRAA